MIPVKFTFYERPFLLNAEGKELGQMAEGTIPPRDITALRTKLFKVEKNRDLAEWLDEAGYVTTNYMGWQTKDITPALRTRFFQLRNILAAWLTGGTKEALEEDFPTELVEEVCWTESLPAALAQAAMTPSGVGLHVYSPRIALILSVHMDRFWRDCQLYRRCPKCEVVFKTSRANKLFCSQRCKRAAGALAYYRRQKNEPKLSADKPHEIRRPLPPD